MSELLTPSDLALADSIPLLAEGVEYETSPEGETFISFSESLLTGNVYVEDIYLISDD